jgi:DNA-binding MarR family transcriptional regulator
MPRNSPPNASSPRLPGGLLPGVLENNISYLTRVVRSVAQQSASDHLGKFELLGGQLTALALIAATEGLSQNDLAQAMQMTKSQMTVLVQDLVVRDIIDRTPSATDRRYNALTLTAKGARLWKRAREGLVAHSDSVLSVLEPSERKELVRLLQKLSSAHLGEELAASDDTPEE